MMANQDEDISLNNQQWELSKENILPLKHGRKAAVLTAVLDGSKQTAMNQQKHEFEMELRAYTGDDPLEVWYKYILWTEQNYPKGGKDGDLKKLIDSCLRTFYKTKLNEKYNNDARYLQLLMKYASLSVNPIDAYETFINRGMCTDLAELYIAYAWELEKVMNFKKANSVFQKAVEQGVKPFSELEAAFRNFQARVAKKTVEGTMPENSADESSRGVLSTLKPLGAKHKAPIDRAHNTLKDGPGKVMSEKPMLNQKAPKFQILSDENGEIINSTKTASQSSKCPVQMLAPQKENKVDPSRWTKNKSAQKAANVVPIDEVKNIQRLPFRLHKDTKEEIADNLPQKTPSKLPNVLVDLKSKLYGDWQTPLFLAEPYNPNVQVCYPKDKVYCGTEEFSLEEIRAALYFKKAIQIKETEKPYLDKIAEMEATIKRQQEELALLKNKTDLEAEPINCNNEIQDNVSLKSEQKVSDEKHECGSPGFVKIFQDELEPSNLTVNHADMSSFKMPNPDISLNPVGDMSSFKVAPPDISLNPVGNISSFKMPNPDISLNPGGDISIFKMPLPDISLNPVGDMSSFKMPPPDISLNPVGDISNLKVLPHGIRGKNVQNPLLKTSMVGSGIDLEPCVFSFANVSLAPAADFSNLSLHMQVPNITLNGDLQTVDGNRENNSMNKSAHTSCPPSPTVNTKFAAKIMTELFDITLSKDKSNADQSQVEAALPTTTPFTIYQDPSDSKESKVSEPAFQIYSDEIPTNNEECSSQQASAPAFQIYSDEIPTNNEECSSQQASAPAFQIYSDEIPTNNKDTPLQQIGEMPVKIDSNYENKIFQDENLPPTDYIQKKPKRVLSGILQPAQDIPVIAAEEKRPYDCTEEDAICIKDDLMDEISPMNDYYDNDFTIRLPLNKEAFSKNTFVASTPAPWYSGVVPQAPVDEDCTIKFFKEMYLNVEDVKENSNELMPPPPAIIEIEKSVTSRIPITTFDNSVLLSPIMEMSRENRSSTNSSGHSTTAGGQGSTFGGSQSHLQMPSRGTQPTVNTGSYEGISSFNTQYDISKSGYLGDRSKLESYGDTQKSFSRNRTCSEKNFKSQDSMKTFEEYINPFSETTKEKILQSLEAPVNKRPGFIQMPLQTNLPSIVTNSQLKFERETYFVRCLKGEGAYARVYLASTLDPMNVTMILPSEEEEDEESQMILKVEKPPCRWEFYICNELRLRIKEKYTEDVLDSFMRINRGYYFTDGSILVSQYHKFGSLLNVFNCFKKNGETMKETLVMYYAIEIFKVLQILHSCEIIHADIKPDNIAVKCLPSINWFGTTVEEVFNDFQSSIKLIDFGRSIDMKHLPEGTTFKENVSTQSFTCCEMLDGKPWTYQTDIFGAISTIHCLLWGSYMQVVKVNNTWRLKGSGFKRYWSPVWKSFFHKCLNISSCNDIPDLSEITRELQETFVNSKMNENLKGLVNTMNCLLIQNKSKH